METTVYTFPRQAFRSTLEFSSLSPPLLFFVFNFPLLHFHLFSYQLAIQSNFAHHGNGLPTSFVSFISIYSQLLIYETSLDRYNALTTRPQGLNYRAMHLPLKKNLISTSTGLFQLSLSVNSGFWPRITHSGFLLLGHNKGHRDVCEGRAV